MGLGHDLHFPVKVGWLDVDQDMGPTGVQSARRMAPSQMTSDAAAGNAESESARTGRRTGWKLEERGDGTIMLGGTSKMMPMRRRSGRSRNWWRR